MEAKFNISELEERRGATSIGCARPINNGPNTLPRESSFNIFIEIAAACIEGITKTFALPTMLEKE